MATFIPNSEFTQLASEAQVAKTVQALEAHGIRAVVFANGAEARAHVLDLIPLESERTQQVFTQASAINKILIVNGEAFPGRITIVLVKQHLGF